MQFCNTRGAQYYIGGGKTASLCAIDLSKAFDIVTRCT